MAMSYLLYKNKHRAKEFLASFLNYEGLLVVEVRANVPARIRIRPRDDVEFAVFSFAWRLGTSVVRTRAHAHNHTRKHAHARTHAGDGFMTWNVYQHHDKPWVAQMVACAWVHECVHGCACVRSLATAAPLFRSLHTLFSLESRPSYRCGL